MVVVRSSLVALVRATVITADRSLLAALVVVPVITVLRALRRAWVVARWVLAIMVDPSSPVVSAGDRDIMDVDLTDRNSPVVVADIMDRTVP